MDNRIILFIDFILTHFYNSRAVLKSAALFYFFRRFYKNVRTAVAV